ncbi:MAG: GntR family transcriptional regulator [Hyphomicrobiaceae bacterium]|nr:GntR family transcriptional regulator [Hyphomicrobiaceae bacterium]
MTASVHSTIHRRILADELADRVRDLIIAGDLKPDAKIAEAELCAHFGVSRTPLREAIKMLAAEGLITLTPHRGARIASITADEIAELFPIMGALEAMAGELAITRMTEHDLAKLETLHATMLVARKSNDWISYSKTNRAIHESIFRIAANTSLTQIYDQLMIRIHAVRFVAQQPPAAWDQAVTDHEAIMQALRTRNASAIGPILRTHLANKAKSVIAALKT